MCFQEKGYELVKPTVFIDIVSRLSSAKEATYFLIARDPRTTTSIVAGCELFDVLFVSHVLIVQGYDNIVKLVAVNIVLVDANNYIIINN